MTGIHPHRPAAPLPHLAAAAAVAILCCTVPAAAQMELAVIQGTVVDENGQPLGDVTFRLRDLDRGRETIVKSDENGRFYRRGLQAVEYEIVVEKEGYQPIHDRLKLSAGMDRRFDFKLAKAAPAGAGEFQQGVAAYNAGDFANAARLFEEAIAKAPAVPELHVNLALAYFRLERPKDAAAALEKAAALGPDDPTIRYQLGSAYVEMNEYDKAIAAFEQGLASRPDLASDALAREATTTLGAVYFATGKVAEAAEAFERVLAASPGAPGALLGMGKVHFSRGESDEAVRLFQQVVKEHPGTPEAAQAEAFLKELGKAKKPGGMDP